MTATFTQRGGLRYGEKLANAGNATWPFAKLVATPEQLQLVCPMYPLRVNYLFPRATIRRLSRYCGAISTGLRIEHTVKQYPEFVIFWTFRFDALKRKLQELGYVVNDDEPAARRS